MTLELLQVFFARLKSSNWLVMASALVWQTGTMNEEERAGFVSAA